MNKETIFQREVLLEASKQGFTLFRNNVGKAYVGGKVVNRDNGLIVLQGAQLMPYGLCVGSSDLIGYRTVTITPEMVGQTIAQFVAFELKTEQGRASKEQKTFVNNARKAGALALFLRDLKQLENE